MSNALKAVKANFDARVAKATELRTIDEGAAGRAYDEGETARVTELRTELESIDGRLGAMIEQEIRGAQIDSGTADLLGQILDRDSGTMSDERSMGQRFTGTDEYRSWAGSGARGTSPATTADLDLRAVTNVTLGATSGGALTRPERLTRIGQDFLDRRVFLSDLIPHIPVTQAAIEYVQDQTPLADMADAARETLEGVTKPQVGPTLGVISEPIPVVAAWANLTRQTAMDIPQVMGYLDGRLRYALKRRVDAQGINGDGISPNLKGLLNRTGIVAYAPVAAEARYKSIRRGIRLLEDVESVPEIIVLNPSDAELFDLSNDTTAGLHANPDFTGGLATPPTRTAWGLTQVRSTAIAAGTALLIDPMGLAFMDRMQVTSYMTDSHASNFTANILTLLLECRVGLALFNPKSIAKITFNGAV